MSCGFSRETLALHVEGDLPDSATSSTVSHLASCLECRRFLEELQASQALMKTLRRETVSPSDCTAMRRNVMAIVTERPAALGWGLRIERAIALQLRPSYGMAAFLLLGVLSVSLIAQMRPVTRGPLSPALDTNALVRPDGYRQWIVIDAAEEPGAARNRLPGDRVYMDPSSYRQYVKTGKFPNGTVLVWESASAVPSVARDRPHGTSSTLLVSLKDSTKFEGGWGFFDFSGTGGAAARKAEPLPESRGCRTCHRQNAKNDHVFTQFSPALRSGVRLSPSSMGWGVPA